MPSILDGFDSVQQALAAQTFALSIAQKNITNANDPDYTREDVVFTGDDSESTNSGVAGVSLQAVRNQFLDYNISQETQSSSMSSVESDALQQIDAIFNGSGESLQQSLSDFFNSFTSLSSSPEDLTLRQQVLSSANALSNQFHTLYSGIQQVQTSEDSALSSTVDQVNSLTSQIAALNQQIAAAQGAQSQNLSTLQDSRQQLVEQLSGLMGLSYYQTNSGAITVTTQQGGALVIGNQSNSLQLSSTNGTFQSVLLNGADITNSIGSGTLGGLIDMRDNKCAGYLNALDDLAATITFQVNQQHEQGSDLNGQDGGDLFTPFTPANPDSNAGAARAMSVAITDPTQIAAAGPGGGAGDNTNAQLLAGIGNQKLFSNSNETASQFYADLVYRIGTDEQTASDNVSTQQSILDQLNNQRDSFSGVSLDDEAVNIIKYQTAYQASAQYATVLNTLSGDVLNILGTM
jgi:flagellar hook-associated protein 1 FlgK